LLCRFDAILSVENGFKEQKQKNQSPPALVFRNVALTSSIQITSKLDFPQNKAEYQKRRFDFLLQPEHRHTLVLLCQRVMDSIVSKTADAQAITVDSCLFELFYLPKGNLGSKPSQPGSPIVLRI